jgi:hypothetical protein
LPNLRVERAIVSLCASIGLYAQETAPPVDGKERMHYYLKTLVSPSAVFSNVLIAGVAELHSFPREWPRTEMGFAKRLGSQYAQFFLDNTIELGFSAIHKEDNRYLRVGSSNVFRRFGSVVKSTVVVSNGQGGQTIALGQIAGAYGSWAIASQVWEPPSQQGGTRILIWGTVNLAAKGARNLFKEFGPDLQKKLHP